MISLTVWFLLLVGILVWPELVLCGLLLYNGYVVLAIVAFVASFYSGKSILLTKIKDKS